MKKALSIGYGGLLSSTEFYLVVWYKHFRGSCSLSHWCWCYGDEHTRTHDITSLSYILLTARLPHKPFTALFRVQLNTRVYTAALFRAARAAV